MGLMEINQLLATLNIFDGNSWANMFKGLWALIGRVVYAIIIIALGRIADICQMIFKKLAGIGSGVTMGSNAVEGDIVLSFINSARVRNIFFALLILAVIILIMATFIATIKTEFNKDGNNNKRKVIKNAFRGLANFVLVPVICLFGLFVGNALLRAIDGATNPAGTQTTLSAQIFLAGGYNANRARMSENHAENSDTVPYINGSFGAMLTGNGSSSGFGNFGIFFDDDPTSLNPYRAADKIDAMFAKNYYLKVGEGFGNITQDLGFVVGTVTEEYGALGKALGLETTLNSNTISYSAAKIWYSGFFMTDIKITGFVSYANNGLPTSDPWTNYLLNGNGVYKFKEGDTIPFTLYNVGLVYYYYNTNIGQFSYLISGICLIFCSYVLLVAALGLVKRLFYLTTLFIISPPICATYPLDDGKILGNWRSEFIKYSLSAYGTVVVLNIFLIILPLILQLNLFTSSDFLIPTLGAALANYFARILIVIGGLLFFKDATKAISGIIGAADANSDGADKAKAVGQKIAVAAGLAMGGAALAGKAIGGVASKAGKGISNIASKAKDASFAKKHKADSEARNQAAQENGGKTDIGGSVSTPKNSMNFTVADGNYKAPDLGFDKTNNTKEINTDKPDNVESKASDNVDTKASENSFTTGKESGTKEFVHADDNAQVEKKPEPIDWHAERMKSEAANKNKRIEKAKSKYDAEHGEGSYEKKQELDKLIKARNKRRFGKVKGVVKGVGSAIAGTASIISSIGFNQKFGFKEAKNKINPKKNSEEISKLKEEDRKRKEEIKENKEKITELKKTIKTMTEDQKNNANKKK